MRNAESPLDDKMTNIESLREELTQLRRERDILMIRLRGYKDKSRNQEQNRLDLSEFSQLLSTVRHDVVGGLGAIRVTIGYLDSKQSSTDGHQNLQRVLYRLDYCELALRNIWLYAGQTAFRPNPVNLWTVFQELHPILDTILVDIAWTIDNTESVQEVLVDENQIKVAFMNIILWIGNMLPDGGFLNIYASKHENMVNIEIHGTKRKSGRKIPTQNVESEFDSGTIKSDLKLQIADGIINRHKGTMEIRGNLKKKIMFFSLHIPIQADYAG